MTAADVAVRDVSWNPGRGAAPVLHPTSFDVPAGRVLGIVGPNGAGKSTLLRLLYRYLAPQTGSITVAGRDIWSLRPKEVARMIAAVLQEQTTVFGLTVREIAMLGRTPHRSAVTSTTAGGSKIVDRVLDRLGLLGFAHRDFGTLSGGERQRVMVARALVQQPQVLVLDEPTNHLDIRHQLEVLALIRDLDLTIVVSLHDLNMAAGLCDDVLVLQDGHPRGFGPPEALLSEALVSDTFQVEARREHLSPSNIPHLTFHLRTGEHIP
ncbi:ABC transporter ATP-binding protein [Roseobacter weihaiensis]|uniref:ABC transporter ATP-binding protein n=1 Tax=Roseobacter weihaiensis TaxID=2763262 RepID=UPI001D09DCD5|nr:ABC transporter ATP-binding protein [Roseobacter sp. H9]